MIRTVTRGHRPVRMGSLGSPQPISEAWGYDRGTPVDRWYIAQFLDLHRTDVRGHCLEVKDSAYTDRYGSGVTERAVLDIDPGNGLATHIGDLADGSGLPDEAFDCFICTQTLQYVYDLRGAAATIHRLLRPGGVALVTVPAVSRVTGEPLTDMWRFTELSAHRLFSDQFGSGAIEVGSYGNVLAQVAFLEGLAAEDLSDAELGHHDPNHPLLITVRAVK